MYRCTIPITQYTNLTQICYNQIHLLYIHDCQAEHKVEHQSVAKRQFLRRPQNGSWSAARWEQCYGKEHNDQQDRHPRPRLLLPCQSGTCHMGGGQKVKIWIVLSDVQAEQITLFKNQTKNCLLEKWDKKEEDGAGSDPGGKLIRSLCDPPPNRLITDPTRAIQQSTVYQQCTWSWSKVEGGEEAVNQRGHRGVWQPRTTLLFAPWGPLSSALVIKKAKQRIFFRFIVLTIRKSCSSWMQQKLYRI